MCDMVNIVDKNKYILEIETEACTLVSVYEKTREGLENAFFRIESFLMNQKSSEIKILCSDSKEIVWSISDASLPQMPLKNI